MAGQIIVHPWDPNATDARDEFESVMVLHRAHRSTLGHLPFAAFEEAGRRQQLLLGSIDGQVCGYVLYSTPRQSTVKLVHVCVGDKARGSGVARAMVDFAVAQNPDRGLLTAHCRVDYNIDGFWRSLDMTPTGERPGRAARGSTLTIWARRIGQMDLLEAAIFASTRPLAVIDTNVVIDLYSSTDLSRPDRKESLGLTEDWLVDLVELAVSPEVAFEVNSLEPAEERLRVRAGMNALTPTRRASNMRGIADALVDGMPKQLVARDPSLRNDARHLADAILAGADYFVTRDDTLLKATGGWVPDAYGTAVVRPVEFLRRLIPPAAPTPFRSGQLESVGLEWTPVSASTRELEDLFLDRDTHEKGTQFRKQLQAALARPATVRLEVLTDDQRRAWALLATEVTDGTLLVSTLRVGGGPLGATISFQMTRYLRDLALSQGLSRVEIDEPIIAPVMRAALETDGFSGHPLHALLADVPDAADIADVQSAEEVADYERRNWPQIVLGRPVPVRVVPIQPRYARELLGFNETVLRTRERRALGFSREFVYFAAPMMRDWDVPARVVWYVTKDHGAPEAQAVRAVVAHSRVVGASVMDVDDAIERYRSLGVLKEREISEQSKRGKVLVLRFEDTHLLSAPVSQRTFYRLLRENNVTTSLLTARLGVPQLFDDVIATQLATEEQA